MVLKQFFKREKQNIADTTIIINIWKRSYFNEQISALLTQTMLPKEIWVIQYEHHVEIQKQFDKYKKKFKNLYLFKLDKNLVFFGRNSIAMHANTEFIWIIDDDIIPSSIWLERCVEKCNSLNSIITCTGRIIPKNDFRPEEFVPEKLNINFIGDRAKLNYNFCNKDTVVDFGCNSYFFKKLWVKAFWETWPLTFFMGDDIHLSATCKTNMNIKTVVLEQTNEQNSGNIKKSYGFDDDASWKASNFHNLREKIFKYHIQDKNWRPLLWEDRMDFT